MDAEIADLEQPDLGGLDEGLSIPTLKGRYYVYPDQPQPALDSPTAPAYLATARSDPRRSLFALIGSDTLPPRIDMLDSLRAFNLPGMLKVVDWGLIDWPGQTARRFAVVIDRPAGPRVMPSLTTPQPPLGEEELTTGFLQPLLQTLKDLGARGVAHRGIRPTNLFYADEARRQIVLGEGVTAPPAHDQPVMFEAIEAAMCHPTGRGNGNPANDMYSLGVTLLFLMLGRNPVPDLDEAKLLSAKIEMSSYVALAGQVRIPINMIELLRGLLVDDERERWTTTDLDMWLSGRRQSSKQAKLPPRASRPFQFGAGEYVNTRALAHALASDYRQAIGVVRSKSLDSWLRRSLTDEVRADALQAAIYSSAGHANAKNTEERMVARAMMVLDPSQPIRYRGFGVMVDGLGTAMAAAVYDSEQRALLTEIISARLPIHWVAAQVRARPEDLRASQITERLPSIIEQSSIGYGYERCLYELNPQMRCLSPIFERDYVAELPDLLSALDRIAQTSSRPDQPMDRHIAAFIASRMRRPSDELLRTINQDDPIAQPIAVLKMLASVQDQAQGLKVPALAQWMLTLLTPAVSAFHHRGRRERIEQRMKSAAANGGLTEMLAAIDDGAERQADGYGFNQARAEFQAIDRAIRTMDATVDDRREEARLLGEQVAGSIGGLVVAVAAAVTILLRLV